MTPLQLYPEIQPFTQEMLQVSPLHSIYLEQSGNPSGKPVILLHGGPGGGSNPNMRRFHDPRKYRIITFDQRGCGKSIPHAELRENTTWHLVEDMEKIRLHLNIDRWQVFGGSWGSTLSLAYAQTHPDRVSELVLRGIFMARKFEIDWLYSNGASIVFPDHFEDYQNHIPENERHDMVGAYYKRLTDPDPKVQIEAARLWARWEAAVISLLPDPARIEQFGEDSYAIAFARIECHYFQNKAFFNTDDHLLRHVQSIRHIPASIIHGRYDMCTPFINAWQLKKMWPEAELHIVEDSGHASTEKGIIHELVKATRQYV